MSPDYTKLFLLIVLCLFVGFLGLSYYHTTEYYNSRIAEINNNLTEAFALGENLLNKTHTFDFKFVITDSEGTMHEFYTHKYTLRNKSKYFDIFMSYTKTDRVYFSNISKHDFMAVLDVLYHGKIRSDIPISSLPKVMTYLDTFMMLNKFLNYTDNYFAHKFNNYNHQELNNIDIIANVYSYSKKYNLPNTKLGVLNNIYYNWRVQNLFNESYLAKYPGMFYDYVRFLKCDKVHF
jgi:hypothetical protein